jgi:PilZ domain-containing protein
MLNPPESLGVLTRELRVRILNCSASGCLLETNARLPVGTIGSLSLRIGAHELADDIRVVRCQPIAGAGDVFHVGAQFLWTALPGPDSLRLAVQEGVAATAEIRVTS